MKSVSKLYHEMSQRNIAKCHEARRANPELARAIATKASAAANAKLTPEGRKRISAEAQAVRLLKWEAMTPEEREAEYLRRVEANRRGHETRRRKATELAQQANAQP